jgi:hypothetical protein
MRRRKMKGNGVLEVSLSDLESPKGWAWGLEDADPYNKDKKFKPKPVIHLTIHANVLSRSACARAHSYGTLRIDDYGFKWEEVRKCPLCKKLSPAMIKILGKELGG